MNSFDKTMTIFGVASGLFAVAFGILFKKSWIRPEVANKEIVLKRFKLFLIINGMNLSASFVLFVILDRFQVFIAFQLAIAFFLSLFILVRTKVN